MAQKKKRRGRWGERALFYILFPLVVWGVAFLVWFYWYDLKKLVAKESSYTDRPKAVRQNDGGEPEKRPAKNRAPEKLLDEDRRQLEDIIKRRG
jgi:hypothetical protein